LGAADPDFIIDLFAGFGPVTVRRMFSGAGVFADSLMIALVVDSVIYLKADDSFIPLFQREGETPFSYKTRNGAHADVVLADAGALVRRAGRTRAMGAPGPGGGQACGNQAIKTEESLGPEGQATLASTAAASSGSVSQMTRLRPLRLAA
jgi:hypothetical protein